MSLGQALTVLVGVSALVYIVALVLFVLMSRSPLRSYVHEKLYLAVLSLVTDRPLRQRLEDAAMYATRLQADDFPDADTARRWRELYEDLTWLEPQDPRDGSIRATTRNLIEYDADKLAERIVSLFMRC